MTPQQRAEHYDAQRRMVAKQSAANRLNYAKNQRSEAMRELDNVERSLVSLTVAMDEGVYEALRAVATIQNRLRELANEITKTVAVS